jgi:lysylphosphatidylglycerol synthetase-like protein (DUF2156 family)
MDRVGIAFGLALVMLGVGAYAATGGQSVTALIPAFFGVPLTLLGFLARNENRRKLAMHLAAVLALLGLAGSARGVPGLVTLLGGGEVARPAAVTVQAIMATICLGFLVLAIRSFVLARRARA